MDVSKMCIDSPYANQASTNSILSSERDTLPSLSQVSIYGTVATTTAATAAVAPIKNYNTSLHSFVHNNSKSHTYQNISPAELRTQYQHQYQLQHQYLKSYKRTQDHQFENQTDDKPYYYPFQTDSSFTDATSSSTPLPTRPLAPQPPSSSLQPPTMPIIAEDNPLKIVIDQCTSIYEKIGKYRADPLRESERNQIIEEVYKTAEIMLNSLKEIEGDEIEYSDSIMADCASDNSSNKAGLSEERMNHPEPMNEEYKLIRQSRNLQENARPKYRRRSKRSMIGQRCHSCNTSETPEWRRGPDGARTLCNACGLHYSKLLRKGSLTVQTHNYMIQETTKVPRAIQFPKADTPSPTSAIQNETISTLRISEIFNDDE